jgi:hypothetical protein
VIREGEEVIIGHDIKTKKPIAFYTESTSTQLKPGYWSLPHTWNDYITKIETQDLYVSKSTCPDCKLRGPWAMSNLFLINGVVKYHYNPHGPPQSLTYGDDLHFYNSTRLMLNEEVGIKSSRGYADIEGTLDLMQCIRSQGWNEEYARTGFTTPGVDVPNA